jgi:SAM-dependent methyltransferase
MSASSEPILDYTGERMVPEEADRRTFWEHVHRYRFAAPYSAGRRMVDIASGEGYGSEMLRRAGATVTSIDVAEPACHHARERYGLDVVVGSAAAVPLASASHDVIVSFETLEHVDDTDAFLAEVKRVLKPGGTFIVSTPNTEVFAHRGPNPWHINEMDLETFREHLARHFREQRLYGQCLHRCPRPDPRWLTAAGSIWQRHRAPRVAVRLLARLLGVDSASRDASRERRRRIVAADVPPPHGVRAALDEFAVRPHRHADVPMYFVAVASDAPLS